MPTTTGIGIVKPAAGTEPADLYGVATRLADSVQSVFAPAYTNVTYNGSWTDYGSGYEETSYAKVGNRVQLRGTAKHATTSTTGTVFTLPDGYRPAKTRGFRLYAAGNGVAQISIDSAGVVSILSYASSGNGGFLCFDGVSFDLAA